MSKLASRIAQFLAPVALLAMAAGCPTRNVGEVDPNQVKEQGKEIPVQINRDVDILFVVDNSDSMGDEQASLRANFDRFVEVLQSIEGGLPNVHIGVISTDMGANPNIRGCGSFGEGGDFITSNGGCTGPNDAYIVNIADEEGNRTTNYSGSLTDTFSCMANLGTGGCGFEQPLEAMRAALQNPPGGFLREDAFLAVVFITDEDDCSTADPYMFDTSDNLNDIDSELGRLDSFRCFEFGVRCDPDNPRDEGERQNCEPREDSEYMYTVREYVEFLKGLKSDPNKVIVAGIIGDPEPVSVSIVDDNGPKNLLDPSCSSSAGEADPAVRMQTFLEGFPGRSTSQTICASDLSPALIQIAQLLATVIGNPCIDGDLADGDPDASGIQPICNVTDVLNKGTDSQSETVIPACSVSDSIPCFKFLESGECSETPTGLALQICRGHEDDDPSCPDGAPQDVPVGTTAVVRCVAN